MMVRIFVIFIFYNIMGSIISPEPDKDGKIDGVVQSTHEHSSTHSSTTLPATTVKEEHGGTHSHVVPSDPHHHVPDPIHDQPPANPMNSYPLMNWLKQHTSYAEPIENVQKSSDEFIKNLHKYMLQYAHKSFPNVEAFKTDDHEDTGAKLKDSFGKMMSSVKGMAEHNMNQRFHKSKAAYSYLKENPHDEHRQQQMKSAIVGDISGQISETFPNPITSAKKLLNYFGYMQDEAKPNHSEHESKDGHHVDDKSGHHHQDGKDHQHGQDHDGAKDGHVKEHSEHGEKSVVSGTNHNHSEGKIEGEHSNHNIDHRHGEEGHLKEKNIDHRTTSDHHQGSPPPVDVVERFVETAMSIFPVHKLFTHSNEEIVPEQFMEDLRKLVSDGRLSKNDDSMKEMLNGLLKLDLGQNPQSQSSEMNALDPSQQPSLEANLSKDGPGISNDSPLLSNQRKTPMVEIKSLFEWTEMDRMLAKNPSLEGVTQESLESVQNDVKVGQAEIGSQIVESQSNENDANIGSNQSEIQLKENDANIGSNQSESQSKENDANIGSIQSETPELIHPIENQSIQNDPILKPNLETSSIASESEIDSLLRNTFSLKKEPQDEDIEAPGFYSGSTDWMRPHAAPKEDDFKPDPEFYSHSTDWMKSQTGLEEELPEVEENEVPEETSYTDRLLKIWHEFFPNPFA